MADKLDWQSVRWPSGDTYEGLVKDDACHIRGVFHYSSGDKYMGEYLENNMNGYGVYYWPNGTIYRGQWENSMMHGCGVKITKQPNGQFIAEEGQFVNDDWVGNIMGCSVLEARKAAAQADVAAQMAAAFELSQLPSEAKPKNPKRTLPTLHSVGRPKLGPVETMQHVWENAARTVKQRIDGLLHR